MQSTLVPLYLLLGTDLRTFISFKLDWKINSRVGIAKHSYGLAETHSSSRWPRLCLIILSPFLTYHLRYVTNLTLLRTVFGGTPRRNHAITLLGSPGIICLPKDCGGLGFRKAKKSNEAFLAKLTWIVVSNRRSLCMDAFRSKYKVSCDWLWSELVKSASQT